jgi:hypothetical protein
MMREYPAYARTIAAHIARGQKPIAIAVLLSARWGYFDHVPKVCLRPDEWALGRYEFSYLRGLHAVAVPGEDCTELQLAELLVDLMRAGPALLWAFNFEGGTLYDGEFADDLSWWARELVVKAGADERLPWKTIKTAELVMAAVQRRAAELWQRESERIQAKNGIEEWATWALSENAVKDRVRELFASPWQAPGEIRAA